MIERMTYKPAALTFPAMTIEEVAKLSQNDLESHLTLVSLHAIYYFSLVVGFVFLVTFDISYSKVYSYK